MAQPDRPSLPAIVTNDDANMPSTPPNHSRNASAQLNTPVFVVTPSEGGAGQAPEEGANRSAYPPSPTLSSNGSSSHKNGGLTSNAPAHHKGHSPTKSIDSSFQQHLDTMAAKSHARRPSGNTDLSTFTALDGPRAADQIEKTESGYDPKSEVGAGAGGSKVVEPKRKGFLGKIPFFKRFAGFEEEEGEDEDEEEARRAGRARHVLPDPSPQEMGAFGSAVPSALNALIDPKSVPTLTEMGGDKGLMNMLHVESAARGLSESSPKAGTTVEDRRRIYGENRIPAAKSKSLLQLMWIAFQDKILILLSVAAVISLALGVYRTVGTPAETYQAPGCPGPDNTCTLPHVDWVEGLAIVVAITIVVMVGSVNDYQKELQFRRLNAKKEARNVKCIRDGSERLLSVYDVVVGDICVLEPGEIVPVDGVFLSGHNVKCDESSATGESDLVRKAPYSEVQAEISEKGHTKADPFLLSGSKVTEGSGQYVVIGVGQHSFLGKIMMSLRGENETTPLQLKLNRLAEIIAKLGSAAGLILFFSLLIRFFTQLSRPGYTSDDKAESFIQILIIAVTVVVVAVPEGLPLAVTLALAFATRRMTQQNLLVRVLGSCETMGTATVICTDKTGTLTQNEMSVVAGSIGVHLKFAERLAETKRTNANSQSTAQVDKPPQDFSVDITQIGSSLSAPLVEAFNESIAINSTAFEGQDEHGKMGFVGSKTETALMTFAQNQKWAHYKAIREGAQVVEMVPFSSERKAMGVVIRKGNGYRLYLKGASEVLFKLSTNHVVVRENNTSATSIETAPFDEYTQNNIDRTIIFYANQSLRTIALCYRDFESWPPAQPVDGAIPYESMANNLTMIGVVAIEDPLRDGVTEAVRTAQGAGVAVKMCTGDNVLTARSIATQCGIYSPGGVIMEGPTFRKLSQRELEEVVPRLQVLARSSPNDKKILVDTLKSLGEVVGVTGDGANDAPALKSANVGFAMGIAGTEVAKEASDIILMDDNFASIVTAISWGRCVNDSVKKFLQFQISVNITAVLTTYITAVSSEEEESVLTAVQLLWVNLIMDTFAALALATDPADPENLRRKPDKKLAPLISADMWKMIIGQSIFQMTVALVIHFRGHDILGYHAGPENRLRQIQEEDNISTLVFNSFVFCQIFNMLNARKLDRTLNVLKNVYKNYWFMTIWAIMIGGQALIVNVGGAAFSVTRIDGKLWAISIVIGLLSLPVGVIVRLLPTRQFENFLIRFKLLPDPNALPEAREMDEEDAGKDPWNYLRSNLQIYSKIRGGRLNATPLAKRSKIKKLEEKHIYPTSLMAMVPSMVMAMPGGLRPEGSLFNPAGPEPSRSSTALYRGSAAVHPETAPTDPMAQKYLGVGLDDGRRLQPAVSPAPSDSKFQV